MKFGFTLQHGWALSLLCEEERATEFFLNCPEEKAQGVRNECETGSDSGEHGVFFWGWCNILELDGDGYIIFGNYWVAYFKRIIFMVHELQLNLKSRKKCVVAWEV